MRKYLQKSIFLLSAVIALAVLFVYCPTVSAAFERADIIYRYAVSDVEFRLHQVVRYDDQGDMVWKEPFGGYSVLLDDINAAQTFAAYIERDQIAPIGAATTNVDGKAVFEQLSAGIYLIEGERVSREDEIYVPSAVLVEVPCDNVGKPLVEAVEVEGKYEKLQQPKKISLSVVKIWKDNEKEEMRPNAVTVQLLKNGAVLEEVELSAANAWKHQWNELDGEQKWDIVEKHAADGYTVSIQKDGNAYAIYNSYVVPQSPGNDSVKGDEESQELPEQEVSEQILGEEKLPQTGQLWWPVPILAGLGILFILMGLLGKKLENNEK